MRNGRVRWLVAILFWSALGVLFALPGISSAHWSRQLLRPLMFWWAWGLLTPLIFRIDACLPFREKQLGMRILAHLPASMIAVPIHTCVLNAMNAAVGITSWSPPGATGFLTTVLNESNLGNWLIYWIIYAGHQTFTYYEYYLESELRLERTERCFAEARLNALRMQLDPHFLFNALNTISSQVERDPGLTRAMIEHLGDLLRLSLEARDRQEIPLAEELAFLDHYIAIQKIRFAEHLHVTIQVAPEVKSALVPSLIVQPLVENAIRHGVSRRASGGTVAVSAEHDASQVRIRVTDDGVGLPPGWTLESSSGTGLSVTQKRILGLHPAGNSRFSVRPRTGGGTEVEISLPLRFARERANEATG